MRADKLKFNIAYKDFEYTENASKLRVFCYMKNGGYAFGDEFSDLTSATFDSTRTAKYSGYGTITIQLIDAEENLINSANVVCKIIESNSTTPFVVSPDFAQESKREIQAIVDNGKEQIAIATKEAKEEIDNWSDQSQRLADTESNIASLQMFKANTGALHFNGGNAQCSGLANKQIPNVNTIAFRWKCDADTFANMPNNQRIIGRQLLHYTLYKSGSNLQFTIMYDDNTQQHIAINEINILELLTDGNWHNVAIISTGTTFDFAVDGNVLKSVARNKNNSFIVPTGNFIISASTTNVGQIADVFHFNFDVTSADALYTIEDYQQGKPIPPKALNGFTAPMTSFFKEAGTTASATYSNGVIDYTGTTTATSVITRVRTPFVAKAGDKIRIVNTSATLGGNGKVFNLFFRDDSNNEGISTGIGTSSKAVNLLNANDVIVELTRDITKLAFVCETASSGSIQDVSASCDIQVEKVGTILALENYTIANGTSQIVFDYSGNNNDATITGNVKGDNDNRVQKLINFITS